jgi:tRNA G18 (ribose-2'-O)-methylase SpoU
VILDDVRSLNNIGSIFRTCDAMGVEKIYLCGITAQPPHREIRKTAIGATESVNWEYAADALNIVRKYKNLKFSMSSCGANFGIYFFRKVSFQKRQNSSYFWQ